MSVTVCTRVCVSVRAHTHTHTHLYYTLLCVWHYMYLSLSLSLSLPTLTLLQREITNFKQIQEPFGKADRDIWLLVEKKIVPKVYNVSKTAKWLIPLHCYSLQAPNIHVTSLIHLLQTKCELSSTPEKYDPLFSIQYKSVYNLIYNQTYWISLFEMKRKHKLHSSPYPYVMRT